MLAWDCSISWSSCFSQSWIQDLVMYGQQDPDPISQPFLLLLCLRFFHRLSSCENQMVATRPGSFHTASRLMESRRCFSLSCLLKSWDELALALSYAHFWDYKCSPRKVMLFLGVGALPCPCQNSVVDSCVSTQTKGLGRQFSKES